MQNYLLVVQAARYIGVDRQTIYQAIKSGKLRFVKSFGKKCIGQNDLVRWNNTRVKFKPTPLHEPFIFENVNAQETAIVDNSYCQKCDGYGYFYKRETNTYHRCNLRDSEPTKHSRSSSD